MNDPKFVILVSLDEPKGTTETDGYATGGWVAAPRSKVIIESIVSLYGILPGDLKQGLPPHRDRLDAGAGAGAAAAVRAGERASSRRPSSARLCRCGRSRSGGGRTAAECVALRLSELMRRAPTPRHRPRCRRSRSAGLTLDSRKVRPGFLFAALPGTRPTARPSSPTPSKRGAVGHPGRARRRPAAARSGIVVVRDANPRRAPGADGRGASPARQPATIAAVTGTNGKTSTVDFVRQIWAALGLKAASVGTLGIVSPRLRRATAGLTTPDPVAAARGSGRRWRARASTHLAIEASSHGLDQHRLDGVQLSAAAFTNLTHDHLDYHAVDGRLLRGQAAAVRRAAAARRHRRASTPTAIAPRRWPRSAARRGIRCLDLRREGRASSACSRDEPTPTASISRSRSLGTRHEVDLPLVGGFQAANALARARPGRRDRRRCRRRAVAALAT